MTSITEKNLFRQTALEAVKAGGHVLRNFFSKDFRIESKGEGNLVTEADWAAEAVIVETIRARFPDHRFLAEEGGDHSKAGSPEPADSIYKWVIDPLDGTTNFAHAYPMFCVSIALEARGEIVLGVVYDPLREETFLAEAGRGATMNQRPIGVSKTEKLNDSLLVTGFAYGVREDVENNLDHFANFCLRVQGMRRSGTAALDLCYVAIGRLEGFWELELSPWDTAAGILIIREAGGRVTDFSGRPFSIYRREILASNGKIHEEMIEVLRLKKRTRPR